MRPGDLVYYDMGLSSGEGAGVVDHVERRGVWVFVGTRFNGDRIVERFPAKKVRPRDGSPRAPGGPR